MRGSTGSPGEVEFTVRTRHRLGQIRASKGFQGYLVDANYTCDPKAGTTDYDLFLSIHYDAYINGSIGGFLDVPDPAIDFASAESKRIMEAMRAEYFKHSGIQEVNRSNPNTRRYYMWQALSAKTPCVLIECGTGQNPHDKVILADTERISNAIARGICRAFGVPFDAPRPPATNYEQLYRAEKARADKLAKAIQVIRDQAASALS